MRMIEGSDKILGDHLWMIEHVLDRAHRGAGHTLTKELFPFAAVRAASAERSSGTSSAGQAS
jgi:hypothetical protein